MTGNVYAQPLGITLPQQQVSGCSTNPCNLVLVATEQDWLYGYDANVNNTNNPLWSLNLAGYLGGTAVDCSTYTGSFEVCQDGSSIVGQYVGVTGTPVIDTTYIPGTLYVVAAVDIGGTNGTVAYYLFAVDITTGKPLAYTNNGIMGSVPGYPPPKLCQSAYPHSGTLNFDNNHIQRSALLFLPENDQVYVAFAAGDPGEAENGWLFAYYLNSNGVGQYSFSQTNAFSDTPYGTGGGIWGSGAGPASDGTNIYLATGNGTIFDPVTQSLPYDLGDTLLRVDSSSLVPKDYYTPWDVLSYQGTFNNKPCTGLCLCDKDFGSGEVMLFPTAFYFDQNSQSYLNLALNADKQSYLYVANQAHLGGFNANGGNNIEAVLTPCQMVNNTCQPLESGQGYWASPAYWSDGTQYWIYYTPTTEDATLKPYTMNGYQLLTSGGAAGPIPQTPTASTTTRFCKYSPTPSVSWDGKDDSTAIVWAIEHANVDNPTDCNGSDKPAALHAFNPTTLAELYSSRGLQTPTGPWTTFSVPTIFNGQVYMGTQTYVDVFGLCSTLPLGCLQ